MKEEGSGVFFSSLTNIFVSRGENPWNGVSWLDKVPQFSKWFYRFTLLRDREIHVPERVLEMRDNWGNRDSFDTCCIICRQQYLSVEPRFIQTGFFFFKCLYMQRRLKCELWMNSIDGQQSEMFSQCLDFVWFYRVGISGVTIPSTHDTWITNWWAYAQYHQQLKWSCVSHKLKLFS